MSSNKTPSTNSTNTLATPSGQTKERTHRGVHSKANSYFESYAEPESQTLLAAKGREFSASFVLPIYDEPIDALDRFLALPVNNGVRSVWVFNAPENSREDARQRTQDALDYFKHKLAAQSLTESAFEVSLSESHHLILVDRCSLGRCIPSEKGVGLARKIGADIALALSAQHTLATHWLYFCDADVHLPVDYFDRQFLSNIGSECLPSAFILPFEHLPDQGAELETELYDFRLRYYVEQLDQAGSPYAYHSLGSVMIVNSFDYIAVRGVPKRSAGEDFYLLNKLAKLNGVRTLERPVISIAGRKSMRVPFGTGPAIEQLSRMSDVLQDYRYYHPLIFEELAWLLSTREVLVASHEISLRDVASDTTEHPGSAVIELWEALINKNERVKDVLTELRIDRFIEHCRKQNLNEKRFQKAFNDWFDALATLRFVHLMRDRYYPNLSLSDIEKKAPHLSDDLANRCKKILSRGSP